MPYRRAIAVQSPQSSPDLPRAHEPRWPVGLTLGLYIALTVVLRVAQPKRESLGPHWLVPTIEILLLLCLLAADPAHIARRRRWLRRVSLALVAGLAAAALLSTGVLINDLVDGGPITPSATSLLAPGARIWLGNAIVFSLIYSLLASGGPYARYIGERQYPDFAFTELQSPELVPPDWRPHYVDYLVLGLTTNTAFSPTDVLPLARWAKLAMITQALIALTV